MTAAKEMIYKYRKQILFVTIFVVAILVRTVLYGVHPGGGGINQDEASIGYDTYALLKSGIDRNGYSFPVHFIAWGSGQNALYAYFSMPFVAIFGLNVFSVRIVNLIFSLLSLLAVFSMVKRAYGYRAGIIAFALAAISPWNIMLSRWGLESNLFPSMFTISLWAISKSFTKRKYLCLAAFLIALTMYSYGASYLVITVFLVAAVIVYLYAYFKDRQIVDGVTVKQQLPLKKMIVPLIIFVITALPIYLFMIINVFDLDSINLGVISIPRTYGDRIADMSGTTFEEMIDRVYEHIIMQVDRFSRNAFPFYGCLYVISLPFFIFGFYKAAVSKKPEGILVIIAFISSMLLFFYYNDPNINRVNAVYMPMIILTALGISELSHKKSQAMAIILSYLICFNGFIGKYFDEDYRNNLKGEFFASFDEAIHKANELADDNTRVYVKTSVNMPYIFVLFYNQIDPNEFIDTVEYSNPNDQFQEVTSFANYEFGGSFMFPMPSGVYIVDNSYINDAIRSYTKEVYTFEKYSVLVV